MREERQKQIRSVVPEESHVYFNIDINPGDDYVVDAKFSASLDSTLLPEGKDYNLAITRFAVPFGNIPFVYFRIQSGLGQTDPNLGIYNLTLRYLATDFTNDVSYIPANSAILVPNPPSQNNGLQVDSPYYYIFYMTKFVDMLNATLLQCRNDLVAAFPALLPLEAPFFEYNSVTKQIALIVERKYETSGIELFYNFELEKFFSSIPGELVRESNTIFYKMTIASRPLFENGYTPYGTVGATPPTWLKMGSDFSNIFEWAELKSLVFKTTLLPVRNEVSGRNNSSKYIITPILTDFIVDNWDGERGIVLFNNQGVYRFADILSNDPIRNIDIEVLWRDSLGVLRPLFVYKGTELSIKLAFILKGLIS